MWSFEPLSKITGYTVSINAPYSSAKDVSAYRDRVDRWYRDTMKRFHQIHDSEDNSEVQLTLLTHYHLQHEDTPDPSWKDLVFGFRPVLPDSDETSLFNFPPECKTIWSYSTYTVNPTFYLQWMQKQFLSKGGTIKTAKIDSLQEIYDGFDVVVNCTGVWASHLLEKESMQPARGQHILVKAPWINHCIHYDTGPKLTYIIARSDSVALGGTLEPGNWSEKIEEETTKEILKRCTEIEPSLAKAEVIRVSVGLRPLRSHIRLEKSLESESPLVIHCYGHGGQGITLSWGCAKEIGDIVQARISTCT